MSCSIEQSRIECQLCHSHEGPAAASVGRFIGDGKRAIVAYADSSVRVWDLKAGAPLHTIHPQQMSTGHQQTPSGEFFYVQYLLLIYLFDQLI